MPEPTEVSTLDLSPFQRTLLQKALLALDLTANFAQDRDVMAAAVALGVFARAIASTTQAEMTLLDGLARRGHLPTLAQLHDRFQDSLANLCRARGLSA